MSKSQASGRLFENRIVIWDIETSRRLFREGYYGKPLGIPKPKDFEFNAPLILDLMEAYYLAKKKVLRVESEEGERLGAEEMEKICVRSYTDFPEKYLVYRHLREVGYVVTPGIKFGSDFAVDEHGPGIDHAPYIVSVETPDSIMGPFEVVRAGRLATTVRKHFILAIPDTKSGKIRYLVFQWFKA